MTQTVAVTDPEREAFARLSVFRGGFTREAAQAVTGVGLRTLMALVNKSLLHRNPKRFSCPIRP